MSNSEKIDLVLEKLDLLLNRVEVMQRSISNFNKKIAYLEAKVESIEHKINKIKNEKATTKELRKQETQTNDFINEHSQRITEISETINNAEYENRKNALRNEMYSKRFNNLIHGIKEKSGSVRETKEETGKLVIDFFQNALLIDDPASVKLAYVHRLPQHPVLRNNKKIVRPIIIKLMNAFDKQLVFNNLKPLKEHNETSNLKPKNPGYVYVAEHLPRELQMQKKRLIPIFRKAKEVEKKLHGRSLMGTISFILKENNFFSNELK